MRHNELDRELPCTGELIPTPQSTDALNVLMCLKCFTEIQYVPNSKWVTIIYPGMRKSMDLPI